MNDSEQWQQHRAFGAVDWASEKHSVIVVDQAGKVIEDFEIEHSALGWKKFREKLQAYGSIPFAIETNQGATVEQLLEAGMMVYPLNPKSAQAYRQRKAPSGVKDEPSKMFLISFDFQFVIDPVLIRYGRRKILHDGIAVSQQLKNYVVAQ